MAGSRHNYIIVLWRRQERSLGDVLRRLAAQIPPPEPLHLLTSLETFLQCPFRLNLAISQYQNVVGAAQHGAEVRCGEACRIGTP